MLSETRDELRAVPIFWCVLCRMHFGSSADKPVCPQCGAPPTTPATNTGTREVRR